MFGPLYTPKDIIVYLNWLKYNTNTVFITFPYSEMVKGGNNIKLSIDFSLTKLLKSLIYKRYGVLVLDYNSIKSFIVNTESNTSS